MNERRRVPRVSLKNSTMGRVKASVPARILNISPLGALVEVETVLRPATVCDVQIPTDDGELRLRARVRRCRATTTAAESREVGGLKFHAGLEFVDLTDDQAQEIELSYLLPFAGGFEADGTKKKSSAPIKIRVDPKKGRSRQCR